MVALPHINEGNLPTVLSIPVIGVRRGGYQGDESPPFVNPLVQICSVNALRIHQTASKSM